MNLISFDLEIAKEIPEGCSDWWALAPLGISCAMFAQTHHKGLKENRYSTYYKHPQLSIEYSDEMVSWMIEQAEHGKRFLTWNGCSFDFRVLAMESGRWLDCARLCLEHVDMMLIATILKGWYVSLDSALAGHGIESKQHRVQLRDGSFIDDMNGAKVPALWKAGETQAVLDYLRGDVERPLLLAQDIMERKELHFISKKGIRHIVDVPKLWTVKEMLQMPMADNSWMENAPSKRQFVEWMFPYVPEVDELLGVQKDVATM